MPKVSVIIATYNRATFLPETLDSVRVQTDPNYELVVVDDGSTDETREVVERDAGTARYLHQENRGRSSARNLGITQSTGDYLLFLDSDDLLLPHALATLAGYLDQHPEIGVVYSDGICFDSESGREIGTLSAVRVGTRRETWLETMVLSGVIGPPHCAMVRRRWLDVLGDPYFDEALSAAEDADLWIRLAAAGGTYAEIEVQTCRYRIHAQNTYAAGSPGFAQAVASYHAQRWKVFEAPYFPGLSQATQRAFLYSWLVERLGSPIDQEDVLVSRRFRSLDPSLRAYIVYFIARQNALAGHLVAARQRFALAATYQPRVPKYWLAAALARLGTPALAFAFSARGWLRARSRPGARPPFAIEARQ